MLETDTDQTDPLLPFDGRQSEVAAELQRGVCRAFRARGHSVVTELSLANGRRADVVALSPGGDVHIVEIKSCLLDYRSDAKWQDYLSYLPWPRTSHARSSPSPPGSFLPTATVPS
jgi:hypothetical protein